MDENKIEEKVENLETDENVSVDEQQQEKKVDKKNQMATKKDILIALGIVLGVLVVTVSVILGCVFGIAGDKADDQIWIEESVGVEISRKYLLHWLNNLTDDTNSNLDLPDGTFVYSIDEIKLEDADRSLKVERPIENSHYVYTFEFEVRGTEYQVKMDARYGTISSVEIAD